MKKSLLAVALAAAAFAASAASAATVYDKDGTTLAVGGQIEVMIGNAGNKYFNGSSQDVSTRDRARVTMSGRTQLTDGIAAYAYNEWEINHKGTSQEDQSVNARQQYLGVDFGKFGKVQVGRYVDPFEYVSNLVDILDEVGVYGGFDERNSGHISYMWSGFGFDAGVSYQFAVDNYRADIDGGNYNVDSGFSVYAGYTTPSVLIGPIAIRAAYLYLNGQDLDDGQQASVDWMDANGKTAKQDGAALFSRTYMDSAKSLDFGLAWGTNGKGLYLATHYNYSKVSYTGQNGTAKSGAIDTVTSQGSIDTTYKAWESVVTYGFDNGVRLGASYHVVKQEENANVDKFWDEYEAGSSRWVELIADYNVTPNFKVWAEAVIDFSDDATYARDGYGLKIVSNTDKNYTGTYNEGNGHNALMVGARYVF